MALGAAPPVIDSFSAATATVQPGAIVTLTVQAHDPDCASGTCTTGCGAYIRADLTAWSAAAGSIVARSNGTSSSPYAASADWQAPTTEGTYAIDVSLSDSGTSMCGGRQTAAGRLNVLVTASTNRPPVVAAVTASPAQLLPGETSRLGCTASDPDGDALSFSWSADAGTLTPSGASATFAGSQPGPATITCTATDPQGASGSGTAVVSVTDALAESRIAGDLTAPQRVAVGSMGEAYVADPGRGGIVVLSLAEAAEVYSLTLPGVSSVAVDWQERLVVGGAWDARVIDRQGHAVRSLDPGEPLGGVADVAVDAVRKRYAVVYPETSRVVVYDETGAVIARVGVAGDGPAELRRPQGIAFTPEGDLVVADSGHALVKVLGLDGTLRLSFGGNGTTAGRFVRLDDVEVDEGGVIHASDAYQAWVQSFNPDGTLREVLGTYGSGLGQFQTPAGIAVSATYRKLLVASLNGASLELFRTSGEPAPARHPRAVLSPASVTFPATAVGTTSTAQAVTLTNAGDAPLGVKRVVVVGEFGQTNDCGLFLDPGQSCTFSVRFAPETPGPAAGALSIETGGSGTQSVALAGQAFLSAAARLSPGALAFGDQKLGTMSPPQSLVLTSTGAAPLAIASITASPGFALSHGCGSALPPGASCPVSVSFAPTAIGPVQGSLRVDSDAANGPQVATLTGTGRAPTLVAAPEAVDFGEQRVDTRSRPRPIAITNAGAAAMTIAGVRIAGQDTDPFILSIDECTGTLLAPGAACRLGVIFAPEIEGSVSARVDVDTSATETESLVALSGVGVPRHKKRLFADDFESGGLGQWTVVEPPEVVVPLGVAAPRVAARLGRVAPGAGETRTIRLHNRGDATLEVAGIRLLAQRGGRFALQGDGCGGTVLPPNGTCTLRVSVWPASGPAAAEIEIVSGGTRVLLVLEAEGKPPEEPR